MNLKNQGNGCVYLVGEKRRGQTHYVLWDTLLLDSNAELALPPAII